MVVEIFNGCCLEKLKSIDKKFDAIITDPPYGISYKTNHRKNALGKKDKHHKFAKTIKNDSDLSFLDGFVDDCYKLLNDNSPFYCFCSWKTFDVFKGAIEKKFDVKNAIIWDKGNWTAGDLYACYANKYEVIIYATKGRVLLDNGRDSDILQFNRVPSQNLVHQNQKPVELIDYLLSKHSNIKSVIDPFMGSCSTGVACLQRDINFFGCEIDKEYYNVAKARIDCTIKEIKGDIFTHTRSIEVVEL